MIGACQRRSSDTERRAIILMRKVALCRAPTSAAGKRTGFQDGPERRLAPFPDVPGRPDLEQQPAPEMLASHRMETPQRRTVPGAQQIRRLLLVEDGVDGQPQLAAPSLRFELAEPDPKTLASNAFRSCSQESRMSLRPLLTWPPASSRRGRCRPFWQRPRRSITSWGRIRWCLAVWMRNLLGSCDDLEGFAEARLDRAVWCGCSPAPVWLSSRSRRTMSGERPFRTR